MLLHVGATSIHTDAELLAQFATSPGDAEAEAAFAALVDRHGPMVLGVCQRVAQRRRSGRRRLSGRVPGPRSQGALGAPAGGRIARPMAVRREPPSRPASPAANRQASSQDAGLRAAGPDRSVDDPRPLRAGRYTRRDRRRGRSPAGTIPFGRRALLPGGSLAAAGGPSAGLPGRHGGEPAAPGEDTPAIGPESPGPGSDRRGAGCRARAEPAGRRGTGNGEAYSCDRGESLDGRGDCPFGTGGGRRAGEVPVEGDGDATMRDACRAGRAGHHVGRRRGRPGDRSRRSDAAGAIGPAASRRRGCAGPGIRAAHSGHRQVGDCRTGRPER